MPAVGGQSGGVAVQFGGVAVQFGGKRIKPDLRVRQALESLGPPGLDPPGMVVAVRALAEHAEIPVVDLDQLLWMRLPS